MSSRKYTPLYSAYAKAHGRSPRAQQHVEPAMDNFRLWIAKQLDNNDPSIQKAARQYVESLAQWRKT